MKNSRAVSFLFLSILSLSLAGATTQDAGDIVSRRGTVTDDYYAAGGTVNIDADIRGDAIAAGGTVVVGSRVQQDVMVAGGTVTIRGRVQDDVRAAGGNVTLEATIGDDALVAGGNLSLAQSARVGGNAFFAGGMVNINGTVDGDLKAAGGRVVIAGTVHGNAEVEADDIEVAPGARIDGNLTYRSPEKGKISPDAVIRGKSTYTESRRYRPQPGARFLSVITLSVAGAVLLLLFPSFTQAASARVANNFWKNLGLGFALMIATPAAAILSMAVVVGVWVGLPMMALYFVAMLLAYLIAAFFVAELGARLVRFEISSQGRRIVALVVAVLLLTALRFVPVIGGLVIFLLMLTALGASALQVFEVYQGGKNVVPARAKTKTRKSARSRR